MCVLVIVLFTQLRRFNDMKMLTYLSLDENNELITSVQNFINDTDRLIYYYSKLYEDF